MIALYSKDHHTLPICISPLGIARAYLESTALTLSYAGMVHPDC